MKRLLEKAVTPDQLLKCSWDYAGSELVYSSEGSEQSQHRILTHWRSESGEIIGMLLNFVCRDYLRERVIIPSSQIEPEILADIPLVDRYGFQVHRSQKRTLEWDLLMRLDIDSVSRDLKTGLLAH